MPTNPRQVWQLKIQERAKAAFDEFPVSSKRSLFRLLQQLLETEVPYTLPFVQMLKDPKFERARRFRVGTYRVVFLLDTHPVHLGKNSYKGVLHIVLIENRKDVYGN